jgi:hypothetical protein
VQHQLHGSFTSMHIAFSYEITIHDLCSVFSLNLRCIAARFWSESLFFLREESQLRDRTWLLPPEVHVVLQIVFCFSFAGGKTVHQRLTLLLSLWVSKGGNL